MRLRRAVMAALGVATLAAGGPPAAHGGGCAASGLRVDDGASIFEPTRANPAVFPCVDAFDESVRSTVSVAGGQVRVAGSSLNALTRAAHPIHDGRVFAAASSAVDEVTITSGTTTIAAHGVRAAVTIACRPLHFCIPLPIADTSVAGLSINGVGIDLGLLGEHVAIPIPGVGTLHVNHTSWFGHSPPLTTRALWLQGEPGKPDVVVAEAGASL